MLLVAEGGRSAGPAPVTPVTLLPVDTGSGGEVAPAVVAAARRGDARAFETILRHYDRRLRIVADRILDDRQAMDDALQDVAIKALRGLPSYRGDAPLGAWLCRIATTTCVDHLRRRRPEDPTAPDDLPELVTSWADPADQIGDRQLLAAALLALPVDQRVAVILVDQFGYDYRAAADALGVPVGTAASRVSSARARLRAALAAGEEVDR